MKSLKNSFLIICLVIAGLAGKARAYTEGDILLESSWHQFAPYNTDCDDNGCNRRHPCSENTDDNFKVGCSATAFAQILDYWNWPPKGKNWDSIGEKYYCDVQSTSNFEDEYNWVKMPDSFDNEGCSWNPEEVAAVAKLCRDVGKALCLAYSNCYGTWSDTGHIEEHIIEETFINRFRYSYGSLASGYWINKLERDKYDQEAWFNLIKGSINQNCPIYYSLDGPPPAKIGHNVVIDGWRVIERDEEDVMQYHVNYGWGSNGYGNAYGVYETTGWYDVDHIPYCSELIDPVNYPPHANANKEYMFTGIFPNVSFFGSELSGTYNKEYSEFPPYRYFDQDTTNVSTFDAIFEPGHLIQFLQKVVVTGNSEGGFVKFLGLPGPNNTILFTRGDKTKGIRIYDGEVALKPGGQIMFY